MNPLKRIRRFAAALAGLAGALVAFGATPAFATRVPPWTAFPCANHARNRAPIEVRSAQNQDPRHFKPAANTWVSCNHPQIANQEDGDRQR